MDLGELQQQQQRGYGKREKVALPPPDVKHRERDMVAEMAILYDFLTKGIDQEDIDYMRQSYEAMLADDSIGKLAEVVFWKFYVKHTFNLGFLLLRT